VRAALEVSAIDGGKGTGTSARASPDKSDVQLLFEQEGHEDAVLSMYVTQEPNTLITCGLDRRVRAWGGKLEKLGVLLQTRDKAFRYPYDAQAARRAKLDEAADMLQRLGPLEPRLPTQKLPALPANGTRSPNDTLASLSIGGKRGARKKDSDAQWKLTVEQVIADPDADEEDYRILFEQMERLGHGQTLEPHTDTAQDRLLRHANSRQARQMNQRGTALTKDEAAAADRLARAMASLGGDDFGTYASMAKSIRPKPRSAMLLDDDDDDDFGRGGYP